MTKQIFFALGATLMMITGAFASDAPLTEDQAQRFVDSLGSVEALGAELEGKGKLEDFNIEMQPKAGEKFKPYSKAVTALKEQHPADHKRLEAAVKPHGFGADEWAGVGDKVMIAYMALKMDQENPGALAQMEAMDQSMLDMMPENMKAQFAQAMVMMETIKHTSPEDKAAVAKVADQLDDQMDAQPQP